MALVLGFVGFNQSVLGALATWISPETRALQTGAFVCGSVLWIALVAIQFRVGARRPADVVVVALTAGLWAIALFQTRLSCAVFANGALVAWSLRRSLARKSS